MGWVGFSDIVMGWVHPWVGFGWVGFSDTVIGWVQQLSDTRTTRKTAFYTKNSKLMKKITKITASKIFRMMSS